MKSACCQADVVRVPNSHPYYRCLACGKVCDPKELPASKRLVRVARLRAPHPK